MAWTLNVDLFESCSCAALCPCVLGPAKPDQGWCSAVFGVRVTDGSSDGVDLSGAKLLVHFELPGDFVSGIDKAKLVVDPSVSDEQRAELDAIFHGEKGGLWGGLREAIKQWVPTTVAGIEFTDGNAPGVTVEGIGQLVLQPITTEDGKPTQITDAPVLSVFNIASENLAFAQGTSLSDPDMRSWESLGQGGIASAVWAG
jgi:hypothetical protein